MYTQPRETGVFHVYSLHQVSLFDLLFTISSYNNH